MGPEAAARAPEGTPGRSGRARLVVINDDTPFLELMEALLEGEEGYAPRGRRGEGEPDKKRPRVIQFLINCWAELQRVQWPTRQQLITLTWVVIGFVIIAGGFLGALDAVFSQLVQAFL